MPVVVQEDSEESLLRGTVRWFRPAPLEKMIVSIQTISPTKRPEDVFVEAVRKVARLADVSDTRMDLVRHRPQVDSALGRWGEPDTIVL
jgi:hypothetical protein